MDFRIAPSILSADFARLGDEVGVGVLEQLCFGPHQRYGFRELLDPAK